MTIVFPKLSAPLVKDIRTGEGIAEWALGVGVAVLTAVGDLGVAKGATYLTILAGLKGARRGLLKAIGLTKNHIGAPLEPLFLEHRVAPLVQTAGVLANTAATAGEATVTEAAKP